jgi:hypothetical protein
MAHLRQKHFRRMDIKSEPTIEEPMDTLWMIIYIFRRYRLDLKHKYKWLNRQ